ncbi:MAG: ABC transporter ATP-binding protein [Actinobacteria bacterium]|nr:ABC transporter ATP-binding protein [Actinomycetota bacterium]
MRAEIVGVSLQIDGVSIVRDVSMDVPAGTFHGVIGPNGSGKSTLLRAVYRSLRPHDGQVLLGGDDVWRDLSARDAARRRAVLAQDSSLDFEFTVTDVVAMGRAPHKTLFERDTARDRELVVTALEHVGMAWAGSRLAATLSGGERQRVFLARAITQQAPVLVLDEPTNHLDVRAQLELLRLVKSLGLTTIAALHDLDQAVSMCDGITIMREGHAVASGAPLAVLTPERIADVFGVRAHVGEHPLTGRPHITVAPLEPDTHSSPKDSP